MLRHSHAWLDTDQCATVGHTGDADCVLIDHGRRNTIDLLSHRLAPGLDHIRLSLFRQFPEPGQVFLASEPVKDAALFHNLANGGPAEIRNSLPVHNGVDYLGPICWQLLE